MDLTSLAGSAATAAAESAVFSNDRSHAKPRHKLGCYGGAIACLPTPTLQEKNIAEFKSWLRSMGLSSCNIQLHIFPPGSTTPGFGAVAGPGGVSKGQDIVQVPFQAFMCEQTALSCPQVGSVLKNAELTPWQGMCLHLLFERSRGHKSQWYPYISLLPSEEKMMEHPLLLPQELSEEWLAGSPMLLKLKERKTRCKEDCEAILASGAASLEFGSSIIINERSILWAASILLSRAFSLNLGIDDDNPWNGVGHSLVLVPWADMLNHSSLAGKESCLRYDCNKRIAYLSAHKSYDDGEQVFDSYGPSLSPSQLFLDYGFVDMENENYSIDLPASMLCPIRSARNEALLNAIGLPPDGAIFSITESGVDETTLAWARAALASEKELNNAGWDADADKEDFSKAATAMAYFNKPASLENEFQILRSLLSTCGTVLRGYPTDVEEDHTPLILNDNTCGKKWTLAHIHARRAITSEKKALRAAWKKIYVMLKKLEKNK